MPAHTLPPHWKPLLCTLPSDPSINMSVTNSHADSLTTVNIAEGRSIFVDKTEYTTMDRSNYPATQLIKLLIQYIGQDLCSFNYHSDVSFDILKTCQSIWVGINKLICDVSLLEIDDDAWDKYATYTAAIDPLEG